MSDAVNKSRRLFLGGMAAGAAVLATGTVVENMLDMMVRGLIRRAEADDGGTEGSRNYVNLLLFGAPVRYGFDHWLKTEAGDPALTRNPMVATRLVNSGGRAVDTEYATFDYKGMTVPWLFSQQVYAGDGSKRPVSDLLDSMLVIRGYGTGVDGHPTNCVAQLAPLGGASSIAGAAADYSAKIFGALQWPPRGDTSKYISTQGKALNVLSDPAKPLHNLMEGFAQPGSDRKKARAVSDRNREAMDRARAYLQAYARSDRPGAAAIAKNMDNTVALLRKGVSNLDDYWGPALNRYRTLIANTLHDLNVPGITDMSLAPDGTRKFAIFEDGNPMLPQNDLRDSVSSWTSARFLAEGFALAEYVLSQGLGTSIELLTYELGFIQVQKANGMGQTTLVHDMHETGSVATTLFTNGYFRAIAACILELRDRLKAVTLDGKNVWEETVLQITSDFDRAARADGTGSDHGYNQMVTSVYSGVITGGPYVIGNIYQSRVGGGYAGSQGLAAPISGYNQSGPPTPLMAASTIAALLRLPKNPFENVAAPLLTVENGQVRILMKGKVII